MEQMENSSNIVINRQDSKENIFVSDISSRRNIHLSAMKKKKDDGLLFMPKEHFLTSEVKMKPPLAPKSLYAASVTDSGMVSKP